MGSTVASIEPLVVDGVRVFPVSAMEEFHFVVAVSICAVHFFLSDHVLFVQRWILDPLDLLNCTRASCALELMLDPLELWGVFGEFDDQ